MHRYKQVFLSHGLMVPKVFNVIGWSSSFKGFFKVWRAFSCLDFSGTWATAHQKCKLTYCRTIWPLKTMNLKCQIRNYPEVQWAYIRYSFAKHWLVSCNGGSKLASLCPGQPKLRHGCTTANLQLSLRFTESNRTNYSSGLKFEHHQNEVLAGSRRRPVEWRLELSLGRCKKTCCECLKLLRLTCWNFVIPSAR